MSGSLPWGVMTLTYHLGWQSSHKQLYSMADHGSDHNYAFVLYRDMIFL